MVTSTGRPTRSWCALPEEERREPPRYQVPLVRRPGRWDVPPQPTWHRPRPGELLRHLAAVVPFACSTAVVTGEWDPVLIGIVLVGNAVANAAQESPDPERSAVPELDDTRFGRLRDIAVAGDGLSAVPAEWRDPARRYVVATVAAAARRRRWVTWFLVGWPVLVALVALVLGALWPQSAAVRFPAATVSAVWGASVAGVGLVVARRRAVERGRFLAG